MLLIIALVIFSVGFNSLLAQCAMCRAVLESDASGQAARGINNGIVYLMVFPYLLVGAVGYAVYKIRRSKS
ncbi:MAG TPA: hypothetical protein DHV98_01910 [Flavobacteriaceae bacterium]|nr:hypothetical protein [Flavobacteriaceae bacterium]